jgi:hypothetical protein
MGNASMLIPPADATQGGREASAMRRALVYLARYVQEKAHALRMVRMQSVTVSRATEVLRAESSVLEVQPSHAKVEESVSQTAHVAALRDGEALTAA